MPFLVGLSIVAALSYEWLARRSVAGRLALYAATTLLVWAVGAGAAVFLLG